MRREGMSPGEASKPAHFVSKRPEIEDLLVYFRRGALGSPKARFRHVLGREMNFA